MTQAEIQTCKSLTPEILFGYSEETRLKKLAEIDRFLEDELSDYKDRIAKYMDALKKEKRKQEKEQTQSVIKDLMTKAEAVKVQIRDVKSVKDNKYQPAPVIKEIDAWQMQEKTNEDV